MSEKNQAPNGWKVSPLSELGDLYCGQSPATSEVNSDGAGTPYFTGPEQWDGNRLHINKWTTAPRRVVPDGCIFITVKGAGVGTLFPGQPGAIGRDVYAYKPQDALSLKFAEHALRFNISEMLRHARGDIPGLSKAHILDHVLPHPEREEQAQIVSKIEELFSDLDAGVAALERVKANLKRYRASVLKAAVEGRLTERWRADHPDTEPADQLLERILTERRQKWEADQLARYKAKGTKPPKGWKDKYKQPAKPDTSKLPKLPVGWRWTNVDQLVEVGTGTTPRRGHGPYWDGGNIPWITSTAVNGQFIHEPNGSVTERALAETNLTIYPKHTLLLALYGEGKTRGMVSELMIAATINQALGALQFDSTSACCRDYLKLFLQSNYDKMRRGSAGGVQPNLNLGLVRQITVPLPPADEQLAIVQVASEELSKAESISGSCSDDMRRAARLRQSILKRAFEGKLVPQDPADEPAQALLARIAEQRAKGVPKQASKPKKPRKPRRKKEAVI